MEKKSYCLAFLAFCLFLSACAPSSLFVVPTQTPTIPPPSYTSIPTSTATPLPTPTTAPTAIPTATKPPLPTIVKHRPTPTIERPVEWDLEPYIIRNTDTEYQGVRIKASVIVDSSLSYMIEDVFIDDQTLAEVVARTFHIVWFTRNHPYVYWNNVHSYDEFPQIWDYHDHFKSVLLSGKYTAVVPDWELSYRPEPIDLFMEKWAKAQQSGASSDWRGVQLKSIFANDLHDGIGFKESSYNFWPMYEGETPSGVTALNKFTIVFVDQDSVKNLQINDEARYIWARHGIGTNLNDDDLLIYIGVDDLKKACLDYPLSLHNCRKQLLLNYISVMVSWLIQNDGRPLEYWIGFDLEVSELLNKGGIYFDIKTE